MLKPQQNIQKFLLSSPSYIKGDYSYKDILYISPAFPSEQNSYKFKVNSSINPHSKNFYSVTYKSDNLFTYEGDTIKINNNFEYEGILLCVFLSILFGKRFDFHGLYEHAGISHVPNFDNISPIKNFDLPFINNEKRIDFPNDLLLEKIKLIENAIFNENISLKLQNTFFSAGKFYLSALQLYDNYPELAYLSLINCGEVLSEKVTFTDEEIFDNEMLEIFSKIATIADGTKIVKNLKSKLFQVKNKFSVNLLKYIDNDFFARTESRLPEFGIQNYEELKEMLKASYDLRSKYVHTGFDFGGYVDSISDINNETLSSMRIYREIDSESNINKANKALTFIGLERVNRYVLYKFILEKLMPNPVLF